MNNTERTERGRDTAALKRVATGSVTGFAAMGFLSGLSPKAPGTAGSALAWLLMWPLASLPEWALVAWVVVSAIAGIHVCQSATKALGVHDHSGIVWDEFVGMWLVLLVVPQTLTVWLLGFVMFRVFDIVKPWPIGWLDRQLPGGLGIMADDILAAVYAILTVRALLFFWPGLAGWGV